MGVELWTTGAGIPGATARFAKRAEDEGWDGIGLVDSQNLAGDPYVELGVAATVTSTLRLATAVTNPLTRHPAVAATAIATVHAASGGRAVLGIGRGDSALAHLGLAPAPIGVFRRYLERLQAYLRGDAVAFDVGADGGGDISGSSTLGLAGGPDASRIRWLPATLPKVPVDVAATGPLVIAAGAALADRVTFAVGASADRVRWAIDVARAARPDVALGIYVPLLVHADRDAARAAISGGVASYARFSVMHGRTTGPMDDDGRQVLEAIHDAYDMDRHFTHGSPQSAPLTDEVIDAFGIAGPAAYCTDRLLELIELGVTKIVVMGGGIGLDRDTQRASRQALVDQVLPALR